MARRAAFLYSDEFLTYDLGESHPLQQRRLKRSHDLLHATGVLDSAGGPLALRTPTSAEPDDLLRVHTQDFLDAVCLADRNPTDRSVRAFGLGPGDTPAFRGIWPSARFYAGGTIDAARLVASGEFEVAFNVAGGLHHAHADHASGFCTFNDLALGIKTLQDKGFHKVAYVDIDVHHGDGVQSIFWDDPTVLTISLHEGPEWLFPRETGFVSETGGPNAPGTSINVPFAPGTGDALWHEGFEAVIPEALSRFRPDALVLQLGADAHFGDPLAHLSLSSHGWMRAVERLMELGTGKPIVVTGGGGYNRSTVPRLWAMVATLCAEAPLPDGIPDDLIGDLGYATFHDVNPPPTPSGSDSERRDYLKRNLAKLKSNLGWTTS